MPTERARSTNPGNEVATFAQSATVTAAALTVTGIVPNTVDAG